MSLFKLFVACGLIAIGALSVEAADMEMQMVDKNCWIIVGLVRVQSAGMEAKWTDA